MPAFPTTRMRPRVMARPIHLTLAASPWIRRSSPGSPSTSKKSSTRRRRFPRWAGRAGTAPGPRDASASGDRDSASSGTFGCLLRVRVIMPGRPPLSGAGTHVGAAETIHLGGVVVERYRIDLLEQRPQVLLDRLVERGAHDELPSPGHGANLPVLDHHLPPLDDIARRPEQRSIPRLPVVENDVRVRARPQVP